MVCNLFSYPPHDGGGLLGYTVQCLSVRTYIPDNSSYSFHRTVFKLGGSKVMRWYSIHCFKVTVHQILVELLHLLTIFRLDFVSSYSFHSVGLKHGGQLDYEVMQRI